MCSGEAIDVDISGEKILTGSYRKEKALQLWSFKENKLIEDIPWLEGNTFCPLLYTASFSKGTGQAANRYILAGGGSSTSNEVKLIHLKSKKVRVG